MLAQAQTVLVPTTPEQEAMIDKILAYRFDAVREKILHEQSIDPDQIDEAIAEFRRYFILIALGNRGLGMTSRVVDEVWHTFILFTRDYMAFCDEVFGTYLHHQPNTSFTPLPGDSGEKLRTAYRQVFGEIPQIWLGRAEGREDCSDCACTTNCQDPDCGDESCRSG